MLIRLFLLALLASLSVSAFAKTCTTGQPCGNSCISWSDTCHIGSTNPPISAPGSPIANLVTPGNGSASVSFYAPSYTGGATISNFTVTCLGAGLTVTASGTASPIVVSGLLNGIAYACSIAATNSAGTGYASNAVQVTPAGTVPTHTQTALTTIEDDGDTLQATVNGVKTWVRLAGVDAPEVNQAYGAEAKQCLLNLIGTQPLSIVSAGQDHYGRTLATVYLGNTDINYTLVLQGCAWVDSSTTSDPMYASAQQYAQNAKLGLWAQANPVAPWVYRKTTATAATRVFLWAMARYANYFAGTPTIDQPAAGAERWLFTQSNSGLLAQNGRIQVYSPALGIPNWTDIGTMADYAALAASDSN